MSPCLEALRDDGIGTRLLRFTCLRQRGRAREPGDAALLHLGDEAFRVDSHDGGNDGWTDGEKGFALFAKVRDLDIARLGGNFRAPMAKEFPDARFRGRIAPRRRARNPEIELKRAIAVTAEFTRPGVNAFCIVQ